MEMTPPAPQRSRLDRILRATPVIGRVCREVERDINTIFWLLPVIVLALVLAVMAWGPAALVLTALAAVVFMFWFFFAVSWP